MIKVVAWDFDGVLNRNIIDGRFVWQDDFERDIGHSRDSFSAHMFESGFDDILTGREDIQDRVQSWIETVGYLGTADDILAYWFEKDAHPDAEIIDLMVRSAASGVRQIIATNNEARRSRYIEEEMGFQHRVEQVFSSGRLGVAKPDPIFFKQVTGATGVEPHEILLIDDLAANTEAAARLGWRVFHFTSETRALLAETLPLSR